jgi:hypothetical protein
VQKDNLMVEQKVGLKELQLAAKLAVTLGVLSVDVMDTLLADLMVL